MATTATPMTLTFTTTTSTPSSTEPSPNQPEKSFRWVEPGKRFRKDRMRNGHGRNSPTTLHHTDSASSDDVASPSSDDSFDSSSGAVVPYAQRITIHPSLNAVSSSQTRKMFSHCMFTTYSFHQLLFLTQTSLRYNSFTHGRPRLKQQWI